MIRPMTTDLLKEICYSFLDNSTDNEKKKRVDNFIEKIEILEIDTEVNTEIVVLSAKEVY